MRAVIWMLVASTCCGKLATASAQAWCSSATKQPIIILPGIMASQLNATYNGFTAGSPCVGRKRLTTVWPPSAGLIMPTGLSCWMYMVQTKYNARSKRFGNNRGVRVYVDPGGPTGTEYKLWQSSYTNLTSYLSNEFGYTLGKDMVGAPFDWRLHISGMERAGQMKALANKIEAAVRRNCGKKAVIIGHSMGGLVTYALLHRDPDWTDQYIGGFISVSAPWGGTSDQAIAVRMGAVDFNIQDWVKMPMATAAADVAASHRTEVAVAVASMQTDGSSFQTPQDPNGDTGALDDTDSSIEVPLATQSRMRLRRPGRKIVSVADGASDEIAIPRRPIAIAVKEGVTAVKERLVSTAEFLQLDKLVSDYVSGIFYKATIGLPGLSMLLPYASAYGSNRRIVVTEKETYTASMMQQLMADIGDTVTAKSWLQVHELEDLLEQGPVPGVPVHCIYAVGKGTTLTWDFPNIRENKPLLSSVPLVTTGGDGTVSVQSLRQCNRITENANITELGDYGHLEVLKNPGTLAELGKALTAILNLGPDTTSTDKQYNANTTSRSSSGSTQDANSSTQHSSSSIRSELLRHSSEADLVISTDHPAAASSGSSSSAAAEVMLPVAQPVLPVLADAARVKQSVLLLPPVARAVLPPLSNGIDNGINTTGAVAADRNTSGESAAVVGPVADAVVGNNTAAAGGVHQQQQQQQDLPEGSTGSDTSNSSSSAPKLPADMLMANQSSVIQQPADDQQRSEDVPASSSPPPVADDHTAGNRNALNATGLNNTHSTDQQQQQQQQQQQEPPAYAINGTGQPVSAASGSPAKVGLVQSSRQEVVDSLPSDSSDKTVSNVTSLGTSEVLPQLPATTQHQYVDAAANSTGLAYPNIDMVRRSEGLLNRSSAVQDSNSSSGSSSSSNSSSVAVMPSSAGTTSSADLVTIHSTSNSSSSSRRSSSTAAVSNSTGAASTTSSRISSSSSDLGITTGSSGSTAALAAANASATDITVDKVTALDDIIAVNDAADSQQYLQRPHYQPRPLEPVFIAVSGPTVGDSQDPIASASVSHLTPHNIDAALRATNTSSSDKSSVASHMGTVGGSSGSATAVTAGRTSADGVVVHDVTSLDDVIAVHDVTEDEQSVRVFHNVLRQLTPEFIAVSDAIGVPEHSHDSVP